MYKRYMPIDSSRLPPTSDFKKKNQIIKYLMNLLLGYTYTYNTSSLLIVALDKDVEPGYNYIYMKHLNVYTYKYNTYMPYKVI